MGYTVSLTTGAASQNEGNTGPTAASYTFTLNRDAGDAAVATNYTYTIYNASTFAVADDFAVNTGAIAGWSGGGNVGVVQTTLTITANADFTIEGNEGFFVYFNIAGVTNPFAQISGLTLVNDDAGPPVFSSSATFNSAENGTAVGTVAATGGGTVTYSLPGIGADSAQFAIDSTSGALTFAVNNNNFEAPDDVGADRVYNVTVRATAAGQTTDQAIAVTLTNVNEAITITSNGAGATAAVNVAENVTAVTTGTATDIDAGDTVTWSIAGGVDAAAFQVDATTGVLTFVSGRNFETPTDSGANNTYVVNLRATDSGGLTDDQEITVTITDAAEAPVITSNGGGNIAILHAAENMATTTAVTTVVATDQDAGAAAINYTIIGGTDAAAFNLGLATGILTFAASPNYEAPADANTDGMYEVIVQAGNGSNDTQTLYIFIDNVIESGVPSDVPTVPGTPPTPPPTPSNAGDDNVPGTAAGEYLAGGAGNDTINGEGGADAIDGDAGNDFVFGGEGDDFVRGLDGEDTIDGGLGADDVNGNLGADDVRGGEGADTVRGGQGNDTVNGNEGDDPHVNGNIGEDIVRGGDGNDTVYGGQGNDTCYGDAGGDRLSGDLGNDILYGGGRGDRFAFRVGGGQDWVGDFNAAEGDRILLAPGQTYTVVNHGGQVVIQLGGGDQIGLAGVSFSSFSSSWIEFGA